MKDQEFSVALCADKENAWIETQIDEFNRDQLAFFGKPLEVVMNYVIKVDNMPVAGIKSCFYLEEVLSIGVLFVSENYRSRGLGSLLLSTVEKEVKAKGAKLAHLYTFDFQAKDFYMKRGYEVFGILDNCPKVGHKCYYMKKNL